MRVHEPERLRPLTQEPVDEGGLAGAVGSGEEDEGGHGELPQSEADFIIDPNVIGYILAVIYVIVV